jgi:hypothetical protein
VEGDVGAWSGAGMHRRSKTELKKLAGEYLKKDISIGCARLLFLDEAKARFSRESDSDWQAYHDEASNIFEASFTQLFEDAMG